MRASYVDATRRRLLVPLLLLATACSDPAEPADAPASPEAADTPVTDPDSTSDDEEELTGRLTAYTGQGSVDASLGRMQVYVENGTAAEVDPRAITYVDPRLGGRSAGDRLRAIPSGSVRGYLVDLPPGPDCAVDRGTRGRVVVAVAGERTSVRVADPTRVVPRYLEQRCTEAAVRRVARLTWRAPETTGRGEAARADLVLEVRPTGDPGRLRIDRVNGTPVLAPVDGDVWRPRVDVGGDDAPSRLLLAVRPRRCDPHAFAESGGATAMRLGLHLDGRPRELVLRMPTPAAAAVLDHALAVCGLSP